MSRHVIFGLYPKWFVFQWTGPENKPPIHLLEETGISLKKNDISTSGVRERPTVDPQRESKDGGRSFRCCRVVQTKYENRKDRRCREDGGKMVQTKVGVLPETKITEHVNVTRTKLLGVIRGIKF